MTLYFQVQFLKLKCTDNSKSTTKNALKKVSLLKKDNTKDQKREIL